jgi:hypothetical protein
MGMTCPLKIRYAGGLAAEVGLPDSAASAKANLRSKLSGEAAAVAKAKTPASFLTGVSKERPARSGMIARPRAVCAGLSVLRVVDSRTWHARSFPE